VEEGSEHYQYTGKEKDATGLYYYGARYYDPQTGKFITRDLIKGRKSNSQTLNLYTYCLNNPIKYIDPTGLDSMCTGDGENRVCIEFTANGWIATGYYNGDTTGVPITDSEEITALMNSDDPADQARAAYLMLLIAHPEIQGARDENGNLLPGDLNEQMSNVSNSTTWFDFHVNVNEEEYTIHIGIDSRYHYIGKTGNIYYGEFIEAEFGEHVDLEIKLYQGAFSSISMLFHVVGHEGVHLLDCIAGREPFEKTAYAWNYNYSRMFIFPFEFDIPMVI
jgi:RHS repeat-associated protein